MSKAPQPAATPSFSRALRFWLKLGCMGFGGPAAQIAMMQSELVDRLRWIDQRAFLRGLNFCTLLPGPEAQQLATYAGWRLHGLRGGIAAGALFVLPGALVLLALSWLLAAGRDLPAVAAVFDGLKPVVVAIVAHAALRIGRRALASWQAWALAAAAFVALFALRIDFPWVVLGAGLVGWMAGRGGGASPVVAARPHGADAPAPEAPAPGGFWRRLAIVAAAYLVLLAIPVAACIHVLGSEPFLDIAVLFTKAAFVTFGGAYAVLPYVAEHAVRDLGWLSPAQMLDGLALAETTPGPLILVLQYVGFLAAWNASAPEARLVAAIAGAALTTWTTFLPSFALVLLGAPWIERLHADARVGSALAAITAAVVGVIANLAVFLALAVLLPAGKAIDWISIAAAVAAFLALARGSPGIHWRVGAGAAFGAARALLG
ncbi:MAG: chromate efflux transporter [Alphaproteobacteria bacterium]